MHCDWPTGSPVVCTFLARRVYGLPGFISGVGARRVVLQIGPRGALYLRSDAKERHETPSESNFWDYRGRLLSDAASLFQDRRGERSCGFAFTTPWR